MSIVSSASTTNTLGTIPLCCHTASLPNISQYMPTLKRPRLNRLYLFLYIYMVRSDITRDSLIYNQVANNIYYRQVFIKLEKRLRRTIIFNIYSKKTNKLIFNILQKVERPNINKNSGIVKAIFLTKSKAVSRVESSSPNLPIFTKG